MSFEKKPCPQCGEEISTHPRWWKEHEATHESGEQVNETTQASPKSIAAPPTDPKMVEAIRRAQQAQERFAKAPNLFVQEQTSDPMKERRRVYCPESFNEYELTDTGVKVVKPATQHVYFGEAREAGVLPDKGFTPVLDENGRQVVYEEVQMWKQPIEMHNARNGMFQKESQDRVKRRTDGMVDARGNPIVDSSGVKDEAFQTERVNTEELLENG